MSGGADASIAATTPTTTTASDAQTDKQTPPESKYKKYLMVADGTAVGHCFTRYAENLKHLAGLLVQKQHDHDIYLDKEWRIFEWQEYSERYNDIGMIAVLYQRHLFVDMHDATSGTSL